MFYCSTSLTCKNAIFGMCSHDIKCLLNVTVSKNTMLSVQSIWANIYLTKHALHLWNQLLSIEIATANWDYLMCHYHMHKCTILCREWSLTLISNYLLFPWRNAEEAPRYIAPDNILVQELIKAGKICRCQRLNSTGYYEGLWILGRKVRRSMLITVHLCISGKLIRILRFWNDFFLYKGHAFLATIIS